MVVKIFNGRKPEIPRTVVVFFSKAFLLFVLWKGVYLYLLLPTRILDAPLTHSVSVVTTKVLNIISSTKPFSVKPGFANLNIDGTDRIIPQMDIFVNSDKTLGIADVCNGLELFVLFAGFLICFPATVSRKLIFLVIGFFSIYVLNIIRCAALVLISMYYDDYLDFSHHFLFTFIVYGFMFLLWYIFTKNSSIHAIQS